MRTSWSRVFSDALILGFSIFVPADSNPLLDILLARGVNGESPKKSPGVRVRQRGTTNAKGKGKATADSSNRSKELGTQSKYKSSRGGAKSKAAKLETSEKVAKGRKSKIQKPVDGEENDKPIAGAPCIDPHIHQFDRTQDHPSLKARNALRNKVHGPRRLSP